MKRVYTAADLPGAYIVLNLLTQRGIDAHVFNENAQGGLGEIPFTHVYPEIWLDDERDFELARQIIAGHENAATPQGSRDCAHCGEANPSNFDLCWNCGKPFA